MSEETTYPIIGLAPLAVLPQFQKQGIGAALVQEALKIAEERGESLVVVLGNPKYYGRFGFEPSVAFRISSPFKVADEYFMVERLTTYQPHLMNGKVVYPPTFDGV